MCLRNAIVALVALFLCSLPVCQIVSAASSLQFGSTWEIPTNEQNLDSNVALNIAFYSAVGGYDTFNYYGSQTSADNIYWAAGGAGSDDSLAFYIGHANWEYSWNWCPWLPGWLYEQQFFISDNNGGKVYDRDIFPDSTDQNVKLAFLYACKQGDTIGGTHWSGTAFGMPYAWLHDSTISVDGYNSPSSGEQVFFGFLGDSVWLTGPNGTGYRNFIVGFYYAALAYGYQDYSVKQALDYAARCENPVYQTFADTDLYKGIYWDDPDMQGQTFIGQMKVYGNSNIHLSRAMPTVAMKTKTNGNFYMPSGPPPTYTAVQIYQLFDDSGIAGDQKGATPPYTSLSNYYPDGDVDIADAIFISGEFGKSEGQSGWEYMADIVPNRVIDIYDCLVISGNNGNSGSYITDLTNVTVTFSVQGGPIQESVDSHGFVTIPPGATSFTVKRSGSAIGAVAIFWSRL